MIAAIIKVHVDPEKFKRILISKANVSIPGSVAFGAFTPFCACGTMAVVVSMLTTALPWGPIMAFLTSSPLMSPDAFIMIAGIISLKFAVALTIASIIIGLASGYLTHMLELRTDFLKGQARFTEVQAEEEPNCCSTSQNSISDLGCGCNEETAASSCLEKTNMDSGGTWINRFKIKELIKVFYEIGVKQII